MTSEEAIDILKTHYHKNPRTTYGFKVKQATEMAVEALQKRKIGRWIVEENPTAGRCLQKVYICDICGSAVGCGYFNRRSFCPACGSEMEDTDGTPLTLDRYEEWKKKKALEEKQQRQAQLEFCRSFREDDDESEGDDE